MTGFRLRAAGFGWRASLVLVLVLVLVLDARAGEPVKTDERRTPVLLDAFAPVARKVAPSVVEVRSSGGDELGLGVAIDDGTYVLACGSSVERAAANHVEVRTAAGLRATGTILARNEAYDVALVRLEVRGARIEPLPLGRSAALGVGQWVIAVGTDGARPLAVGVVSALGRRVEPRSTEAQAFDLFGLFTESGGPRRAYARVIQHDAAVDGERPGAPLVDAEGRLVGLNVAVAYRGSAYAAPIDEIASFLGELKAGRPGPALPRPGYIGVAIGSISDRDVAKKLGISGAGVQIHAVSDGLPAARAGLKAGDVVLAVDGEKVASADRFGHIVRAALPGAKLKVRVLRDGKDEVEIAVEATERPPGE